MPSLIIDHDDYEVYQVEETVEEIEAIVREAWNLTEDQFAYWLIEAGWQIISVDDVDKSTTHHLLFESGKFKREE